MQQHQLRRDSDEECRDLRVRLLKILHAFRLECESQCSEMLWTIDPSTFCQVWQGKLQLNSSCLPEETPEKFYRGIHTPHPNTEYSCFDDRVGESFWLLSLYYKNLGNMLQKMLEKS